MRPVFVCGTGRSGTTVFTRLLGCHPEVWAFKWESQIFSGIPGLGDLILTDFRPKLVDRFITRVQEHLFKRDVRGSYEAGLFEIIGQSDLNERLDAFKGQVVAAPDFASRLAACRRLSDAIFIPPALAEGATMWAEKTPRNLIYADLISALYPEAQFIHVIRDGRDVLSSMLANNFWPVARSARYPATMEFGGPVEFEQAVRYWTSLMDIAAKQEAAIGPERWLNVRLEDISQDAVRVLQPVCEFLGISSDQAAFDEMRQNLKPRSAHAQRWRQDLTHHQVQQFEAVSGENLGRYNYL